MNWQRGFIYCVTSEDYGRIALGSMHSLRQFHDEPIILYWGTHIWDKRPGIDVQPIQLAHYPEARHKNYPHLLTKTIAWLASPFDQTIFIDADTVIRKPLDRLWTDGIILPQLGKEMRDGKPRITTGVCGFGKNRRLFMDAYGLSISKGWGQQRGIETLYDPKQVEVVGVEWNCPVQCHNTCPDPAVAHLDGGAWKAKSRYAIELERHCQRCEA